MKPFIKKQEEKRIMEVITFFVFFILIALLYAFSFWNQNYMLILIAGSLVLLVSVMIWTEGLTSTTAAPSGLVTAVFKNDLTVGFAFILALTAMYFNIRAALDVFKYARGSE